MLERNWECGSSSCSLPGLVRGVPVTRAVVLHPRCPWVMGAFRDGVEAWGCGGVLRVLLQTDVCLAWVGRCLCLAGEGVITPLGALGCPWARDVGCWGAAVWRDVKEGACPGNTGSLLAAAASSLSLYSREILLFSL